jgi:hypothetical protein
MRSIDSDIRYLKSNLCSFGAPKVSLFSDITFQGKLISPREGKSGFFYDLPLFGNFRPGSDLHLSIFDISGFAKGHITFKPNSQLAFHYGYKLKNSKVEEFWITGYNTFNDTITEEIYEDIYSVYHLVIQQIYITRTDSSGNIIRTPYKFNIHGTAGRIRNSEQKKFALREYHEQDRSPPSYLKPVGGISKHKRISGFFNKGPLFT